MPAAVAGWWGKRSLRVRITVAVGGVALLALGALAWLATGLIGITITGAVDVELARAAAAATGRLSVGVPEDSVVPTDGSVDGVSGQINIRVSDTAGRPLDDGPPLPLDTVLLRRLAGGESVTVYGRDGPARWLGVVAIAPDGSPRLVLAGADLVGYASVLRRGAIGLGLAAAMAGLGVALAAWVAVRLALRPVDRMRIAAVSLPPGERLPVPPANDELRALAVELNELLARRDTASARLERFTGDAAHEMRSPVASIRAQAEVAVVHPDPLLAEDTLRSVATEAARLSELVSDLLALARADAGARPPATSVDMVAEAEKAIGRAEQVSADLGAAREGDCEDDGVEPPGEPAPVFTLTAPVPATAAASPGEVALVIDNLLANARRYARSRVWVSVLPSGRSVRVVVDDDGPGVPEEDRKRVFDRFTRLEADRGGRSGGAGLGLALVAALVSGRGGTVRMGVSPDGGARVEARWPTIGSSSVGSSSGFSRADRS
jgi:signal transduction histidine kinase